MGAHSNISANQFPAQGNYVGRPTKVVFHYDTTNELSGVIVRDDMEEPYETIIALDDGRYVRATECQYSPENCRSMPDLTEWESDDNPLVFDDGYRPTEVHCATCGEWLGYNYPADYCRGCDIEDVEDALWDMTRREN